MYACICIYIRSDSSQYFYFIMEVLKYQKEYFVTSNNGFGSENPS